MNRSIWFPVNSAVDTLDLRYFRLLPQCFAASVDVLLPTFRDNVVVAFPRDRMFKKNLFGIYVS